jgi:hypothetical protein
MAGHRLQGGWYEPANDVRFITPQGHMVRAADSSRVEAGVGRVVRTGSPWDLDDELEVYTR